jgi:hypothetical protein
VPRMLLEKQGHVRVLALVRPSSLDLQPFPNTYLGFLAMIALLHLPRLERDQE